MNDSSIIIEKLVFSEIPKVIDRTSLRKTEEKVFKPYIQIF